MRHYFSRSLLFYFFWGLPSIPIGFEPKQTSGKPPDLHGGAAQNDTDGVDQHLSGGGNWAKNSLQIFLGIRST